MVLTPSSNIHLLQLVSPPFLPLGFLPLASPGCHSYSAAHHQLDQETGVVTNPLVPRDAEHGNGEGEGQGEGKEEPTHSYTPPTNPVSHLDLVLTYLWRVHGVDYYAGTAPFHP